MSVTQKDVFELLLDNSENGQAQITSLKSNASIISDICGDGRGKLFATPFTADEVELDISLRMKRGVFLKISELLSRVMQ